ncbi:hypothetical protein O1611_g5785 [Lasiodiplodia mahajangana]|uniref:Uncharacterized protein n=1 Tax=Lasiodiplodia mahajangana TaxID=1108764 RepID=A0ACC2JK19_9PEZI|nr:hypothetical protein O1611_g5785 [Lasiodiplodia mahajangana]
MTGTYIGCAIEAPEALTHGASIDNGVNPASIVPERLKVPALWSRLDPNAPTDSNGLGLLVTAIVMLVVSWLSVALRTYANFTVSCSFIFAGLFYGLGRHNKSLSQHDEIEALKYQALATASYVSNMWLIKLSIGLFLFRLAVQRRYKYILGISIVVVGIWSLVLFFWNIFQCSPVIAQWDYTILTSDASAHCVSADAVVSAAYALSALTVLSDWLYALLPIPMLWQVKMTTQAKWSVIAVLGLGVFASVATLIRLGFLADLEDASDILHAGTDAMIWTLVEPGIAISAASLATIRPLLRQWRIGGFTHSSRSGGTGAQSQGQSSRIKRGSSKMPSFGPRDGTLDDIELGPTYTGKHLSSSTATPMSKLTAHKISHPPKVFSLPSGDHGARENASAFYQIGAQKTETKDDLLIVNGAQSTQSLSDTRTAWYDQESDASSIELNRPAMRSP